MKRNKKLLLNVINEIKYNKQFEKEKYNIKYIKNLNEYRF